MKMHRTKSRSRKAPRHQFLFSKDAVATCTCGGWALAKAPWLPKKHGFVFMELTEDQARKDWAYHIQNLAGKGGHKVQGVIGKQRLKQMLGNLAA